MHHNQVMMTLEMLNNIRALSAVNKEDLERIAARLQLDSSIQLNILWIVYCNEGVRITTIAEWTFWHTSSIVIHVKKLMEKGYVTIEKNDGDGRVVNVYLTDLGREVMQSYYDMIPSLFSFTKALDELTQKYSPTIMQLFQELLTELAIQLQGQEKIDWIKVNEDKIKDLNEKRLTSKSS